MFKSKMKLPKVFIGIFAVLFVYVAKIKYINHNDSTLMDNLNDTSTGMEVLTITKPCKYCINHTQFKPKVQPKFLGINNRNIDMLLLITSSYHKDGPKRRDVIRRTWANASQYLPYRVGHLFVLGKS